MIRHIHVKHFKSIHDVAVDLAPVTVLIGRSGSGKTNFVHALRFLRDYLTARNFSVAQLYGGWPQIRPAVTSQPQDLQFFVEFDAPGQTDPYRYHLVFATPANHAQPVLVSERLSLGSREIFHQNSGKWVVQPEMVYPPQPGELMLGGLTGLSEVTVAHLVLTSGLGCYGFSDTVLVLNSGQSSGRGGAGFQDHADNYLQAYDAIIVNLQNWGRPKEMLAALKQLDRSIRSIDYQMPGRDRITIGHDVAGKVLSFELSQESEGFRRLFAHLIALYQEPSKQTLIFEEPEKGIHPGALAVLADQFKACPVAGRGQVIITTHSPELLNHLPPESIRAVEMKDSATRIAPVDADQMEALRDQLLYPGELLTVTPPTLEAAIAGG